MANPFVKAWKYSPSSFDNKIEENADPKSKSSKLLVKPSDSTRSFPSGCAVIGNQRQLEMKLNRQLADIEKLNATFDRHC